MQRKNNTLWWVLGLTVVLAGVGVAAYLMMNPGGQTVNDAQRGDTSSTQTAPEEPGDSTEQPDAKQSDDDTKAVTITFTDDGFSPEDYTVIAGQKVTVKNASSRQVQFSSDDHPSHTHETELNLPVITPGESASFTPTRIGTWGFHDHINAQYTGTLTVKER